MILPIEMKKVPGVTKMPSNIQKEKKDPEVFSKDEEFNKKASYQNKAQILIVGCT